MDVTADELAASVAELVRIPSVNPLHAGPVARAADAVGERPLAEHVAGELEQLGASEVVLDDVVDGRPNVYGFFQGRSDRLAVVDVHLDTVTVEHMTDPPFDGRIEDDRVWGRGALDTKATMGVLLALLESWRRTGARPEPTLLVVGSIAEEAGGLLGATQLRPWADARGLEIDQMVVAEPTRLAPIHGHKGGTSLRVTSIGRAAHSALPHLGENAIDAMMPVVAALQAEHRRLQSEPPTTELGTGTLSVTTIRAGSGGNVIPDRCTIGVGRRTVPGEDPHEEFERIAAIARAACPLPTEIESVYPPDADGRYGAAAFYQPADTPLIRLLAGAAGTAPAVAPFGTNALRYGGFARELAVFGPGSIDDAHQATECVAIADLVTTAEVYEAWLDPA
ncbi:MAG: M20/M25/M40 family metallo-hydrolase [Ilumatobacter sp.]|uniref:M20 family metallopeptidase n=1 Tax=Ilumatobacter sp. TaxID=1967498 RepID=UPI0026103E97|nr:M20/M25/M40 family metallo-hydrolase [Ilumatobacter sp.]MDJ0767967.1 M20/M25/M40 family metallo-hydrolase [Ilumatobacter sp.]